MQDTQPESVHIKHDKVEHIDKNKMKMMLANEYSSDALAKGYASCCSEH